MCLFLLPFLAKDCIAATVLSDIKVECDWGVKDNDIITLLAAQAGPDVCRLCYAINQGTNVCLLSSQSVECNTNRKKYSLQIVLIGRAEYGSRTMGKRSAITLTPQGVAQDRLIIGSYLQSCFALHSAFQ